MFTAVCVKQNHLGCGYIQLRQTGAACFGVWKLGDFVYLPAFLSHKVLT